MASRLQTSSALQEDPALVRPCGPPRAMFTCVMLRGILAGSLVFLPHSRTGKYGQKAPTWNAAGRAISDFDVSWVNPLAAAASEDGRIAIAQLPLEIAADATSLNLQSVASLSASAQKSVDVVQFHPSTANLLLSMQGSTIQAWDLEKQEAFASPEGPTKGHWSASWSHDGRLVQTAGKDNTINLWDVRRSASVPTAVGNRLY